jgi:pimeloyl-ACP methyl ester carboxylesterase
MRPTPSFKTLSVFYKSQKFTIEYFDREGELQTILLLHGLGGAKENYYEACKSAALTGHRLICMDNPGTGSSTYYEDMPLNVDDLTEIIALFIAQLELKDFVLIGTSMGGLTTLLYLKHYGTEKVKAYINIEGNLMPEDCMFSGKVVQHKFDEFEQLFPLKIKEMVRNGNTGYHIIANNLALNTNVRSYFEYSFQTVEYSATGELLDQFIQLKLPKLFIYGEHNSKLSYIPTLLKHNVPTHAVSDSDHFIFYDNPKELYETIGAFINELNV